MKARAAAGHDAATLPAGRDVILVVVLLSPVVLWNTLYSIQLIQETNQSETESKKHTNTTGTGDRSFLLVSESLHHLIRNILSSTRTSTAFVIVRSDSHSWAPFFTLVLCVVSPASLRSIASSLSFGRRPVKRPAFLLHSKRVHPIVEGA